MEEQAIEDVLIFVHISHGHVCSICQDRVKDITGRRKLLKDWTIADLYTARDEHPERRIVEWRRTK
jgi:hypothetical protein